MVFRSADFPARRQRADDGPSIWSVRKLSEINSRKDSREGQRVDDCRLIFRTNFRTNFIDLFFGSLIFRHLR
jgi:hypothetical protein